MAWTNGPFPTAATTTGTNPQPAEAPQDDRPSASLGQDPVGDSSAVGRLQPLDPVDPDTADTPDDSVAWEPGDPEPPSTTWSDEAPWLEEFAGTTGGYDGPAWLGSCAVEGWHQPCQDNAHHHLDARHGVIIVADGVTQSRRGEIASAAAVQAAAAATHDLYLQWGCHLIEPESWPEACGWIIEAVILGINATYEDMDDEPGRPATTLALAVGVDVSGFLASRDDSPRDHDATAAPRAVDPSVFGSATPAAKTTHASGPSLDLDSTPEPEPSATSLVGDPAPTSQADPRLDDGPSSVPTPVHPAYQVALGETVPLVRAGEGPIRAAWFSVGDSSVVIARADGRIEWLTEHDQHWNGVKCAEVDNTLPRLNRAPELGVAALGPGDVLAVMTDGAASGLHHSPDWFASLADYETDDQLHDALVGAVSVLSPKYMDDSAIAALVVRHDDDTAPAAGTTSPSQAGEATDAPLVSWTGRGAL
ncbi:MAG: protein phosphatase 2C domain-containing protein [Propionibacteriaceae bacterium]|nr:protein phosphatase 2C domain-containing protein [Propionibacteriaceae bacterium]